MLRVSFFLFSNHETAVSLFIYGLSDDRSLVFFSVLLLCCQQSHGSVEAPNATGEWQWLWLSLISVWNCHIVSLVSLTESDLFLFVTFLQ
jgi:hypothetical protein